MECKSCGTEIFDGPTAKCSVCNQITHEECITLKGDTPFCDICYTLGKSGKEEQMLFEVPDIIRRSYIETYNSCPYKFYREVIIGEAPPENIYAKLGIDLHELFDKKCKDDSFCPTPTDMIVEMGKLWQNYPEELFKDEDIKFKMWARAEDSIDNFYKVIKRLGEPFMTEEKMVFSVGEDLPWVQATFDRIDKNEDGTLSAMDWKTGKPLSGQKLSSDLQAPLYIYAIQEHYGMPVRDFTFYYLSENKERVFHRVDNENFICTVGKKEYHINLTDAIRRVQHIFSQIKKGNFNIPRDTKSMYFACKMCHLKENGTCEGADIQSWYNK